MADTAGAPADRQTIDRDHPPPAGRRMRRLGKWVLTGLLFVVIAVAIAFVWNNDSFSHSSRQAFEARLDYETRLASPWIYDNRDHCFNNEATMFMIADMEKLTGDKRLQSLLSEYLNNPFLRPGSIWRHVVDPHSHVDPVSPQQLASYGAEVRWDAYAISPNQVPISDRDRADMFSPTRYSWGLRQHQLFALVMYRSFNGGSPSLDNTMNHLAEKIARDAHWDIRLTDSYVQRSAFMIAAGRPDLVRRRWIERILGAQNRNGSWNYCWYAWCRGIFEFGFKYPGGSVHTTVQAAWALDMLRYRYPQWIDQNYPR